MAMDATILGNAMATACGVTDAVAKAAFVSMAGAIITHIQTSATVAVTITDTVPGTGLLAPTGGGPVTGVAHGSGSGTGTIS